MLVDRGPTTNPCKFAEKVGNATALGCRTEMRSRRWGVTPSVGARCPTDTPAHQGGPSVAPPAAPASVFKTVQGLGCNWLVFGGVPTDADSRLQQPHPLETARSPASR